MSKIKKPAMVKNSDKQDIINKANNVLKGKTGLDISSSELESISNQFLDINTMVEDIIELNPKIELVIEIMTSLIKSPNDGESDNIIFNNKTNLLPSNLKSNILNVIENHIETEYEFTDKLDSIISESLYTKGAYIELNIPLNFIKEVTNNVRSKQITVGNESLVVAYESIYKKNLQDEDTNITTSLAPIILKELYDNTEKSKQIFNPYFNNMYPSAGVESKVYSDVAVINNVTLSEVVNKPIIKKVAPHSIVPICSKSDPSRHYGYFYLVNKDGTEVVNKNITNKTSYLEGLMKDIKTYKGAERKIDHISNIEDLKDYIISNKITNVVKNKLNVTEEDLHIELTDDMLLVLADNMINKSGIKIIYLPSELVSYYAYKYRTNGTGKGLIERVATLASIKGILTFVNLLAYVKSSITTTNVNLTLDEDEVDPRSTVRKILAEVMKNRQFNLPIKMLKVDDFIEWSHKLGFAVNAKHPEFPDIDIEIEEKKNEIDPIETDLFDKIDEDILTALYCQKDILESSSSEANFATTVRQNFFLLNKRIKNLQKHYNKLITKDIIKKLMIDGTLISKLEDMILGNINTIKKFNTKNNTSLNVDKKIPDEILVKRIIFDVINNLVVTLQKPDIIEDDIYSKLSDYISNIDDAITALLSSNSIGNSLGDMSDNLDDIKAAIKNTLIRDYMDNNNILPLFNNIFTKDNEGKLNLSILNQYENYIETVGELGLNYVKSNNKFKDKLNEKLDKIVNPPEKDDSDETGDDTTDTTDNNTDNTTDETTADDNIDSTPDDTTTETADDNKADDSSDNNNNETLDDITDDSNF